MSTASRRPRRVALAAASGIVTAALLLSACSSGDSAPEGSTDDSGLDLDAEVTIALSLFPDNLDLRNTTGAALDQVLIDNVYEGLVTRDASGTISPSLASEWQVSDDSLVYTFTLNEGTTFSNGNELTSEDVVYSFNDVIDNQLVDVEIFAAVESIEATDDTTVELTLSRPDPTLLYNLAGRAGVVIDEEADNDLQTTAVGSGPYLVDEFNAQDSLVLVRNEDYWGETVKVAAVVFQLVPDSNAIVNGLLDGSLDFGSVDPSLVSQVEESGDLTLHEGFASDKYTLAFNNLDPVLSDIRVRQAIRHAIDHEAFVAAVGGGNTLYGPIVESDPGYEDLSDLYPYDPDLARALLAEAGYADGLELTLTIPAFYASVSVGPILDLLVSDLAEVGITVNVEQVEFPVWIDQVHTNHNYQLSIVDHAEARDFQNWANPDYYFGYNNPEVQSLWEQATSATSDEEYASLLAEAARIVSEDAAADWLLNFTVNVAIRDGVTGLPVDSINSRLDVTGVEVASGDGSDA